METISHQTQVVVEEQGAAFSSRAGRGIVIPSLSTPTFLQVVLFAGYSAITWWRLLRLGPGRRR